VPCRLSTLERGKVSPEKKRTMINLFSVILYAGVEMLRC
jgi:hypothetical protein